MTVLEEFSGKELTDLTYSHPLSDEIEKQKFPHKIVMAEEFVTTEEGTGLVHCAPGHGPEDYIIGKRYDLPIFSPIGSDAKYTTEAGKYEGVYVPEANELIIKELKKKGVLIKSSEIMHRYPQCWRCKTKLIHIASKQWFIKVNDIKSKMIEENEKVRWIPEFGGVWFSNFLENARDWCISRQRYWGIPLPIWKCEKCGAIKVIGSKEELEKESSGAKSKELHRPYVDEIKLKCKCGGEMIRVQDVLDVWFDSGNAIWAGLRKGEEKYYPADMILEGKDQIRGWFYSLLGSGVVLNNEVPYKSVIMHGYVVNEEGKEMSKSVGNYVPVEEILKKYEPDAVRLWCLGSVIWEDLRFHWKEIDVAKNDLNIITNIGTYIKRFYKKSKDKKAEEKEEIEDVWLSSRLNQLIKDCTNNMENGEIHRAVRNLKEFSVSELSRFYLKLIKKRENINKLYSTYFTLLKLLSPFIPFTSEKLYREIYADSEGKESIYLFDWPEPDESVIDEMLNSQLKMVDEICSELNGIRSEKDIKIRQPLEEAIIITDSIEVRDALDKFSNVVSKLINVKNIRTESEFKITKEYTEKKTRFGTLALKTELNQEMMDKGVMNEIRRRIQIMRKEVGLIEEDKINVYLNCEKEKYAKEIKKIVTERMDEIKKEVNAENIKFESGGRNKKSWKINDKKIEFGITKI